MDAVSADFGHGSRATHFILSLLLVGRPFASGLPLLVPFRLRNSHFLNRFITKNLAKRKVKIRSLIN